MKTIAITSHIASKQHRLNEVYSRAFTSDTTIPIIIPIPEFNFNELSTDSHYRRIEELSNKVVQISDALVLSGGNDINPVTFDRENRNSRETDFRRDTFELELIEKFIKAEKPVMGICRGFQLLGFYAGLMDFKTDLDYKDTEWELHNAKTMDFSKRTEPAHQVMIMNDFEKWIKEKGFNTDTILVNSLHHQGFTATRKNSKRVEIRARTSSLIEGFRFYKSPVVAFQYHPEEYEDSLTIQYIMEKYINV